MGKQMIREMIDCTKMLSLSRLQHRTVEDAFPLAHRTAGRRASPGFVGAMTEKMMWRLPRSIIPQHYDLQYTMVDLEESTFSGRVSITIEFASENVDEIVMHAVDLSLHDVALNAVKGHDIRDSYVKDVLLREEDETVSFSLGGESVPHGTRAILSISFDGLLTDNLCGLYRSFYQVGDQRRTMAVTQFEAADARRAFPCFDEPSFKATFALTVTTRGGGRTVLSNQPPRSTHTSVDDGSLTVAFETTPVMSTYLLALVIGEFDCVSSQAPPAAEGEEDGATNDGGVRTSVYTPLGQANKGVFALETAKKALSLYERIFGVAYPLAKSDLVAIPDFAAGAMENWGLVTYRSHKILIDSSTPFASRIGGARTICHELAHQWFGNLVTMKWWDNLWLNEGFARFMEFVAVDSIFPEWRVWEHFVASVFTQALRLDALESSHPVQVDVSRVSEVNEIFDAISYAKGASLIRSLCDQMGQPAFFRGLRTYLKKHAFSNTSTDDLWDALSEEISTIEVAAEMQPWTTRQGFPLVTVSASASGDAPASDVGLCLTQSLYSSAGPSPDHDRIVPWPLRLRVATVGKGLDATTSSGVTTVTVSEPISYDDKSALNASIELSDGERPIYKLNAGQAAFCRVKYPSAHLKALVEFGLPALPTIDVIGVINDAFTLAMSGHSSLDDALVVARGLQGKLLDTSRRFCWIELCKQLRGLVDLLKDRACGDDVRAFCCNVCDELASQLGWGQSCINSHSSSGDSEREDANTIVCRRAVIGLLCACNHAPTIEEAIERFDKGVADPSDTATIPSDLRLSVYKAAVKRGGKDKWQRLLALYNSNPAPDVQRDVLQALGCVVDDSQGCLTATVALAFSDDVRSQDVTFPLSGCVGSGPVGRKIVWQYFMENAGDLCARFGGGNFVWGSLISTVCGGFNTFGEADEVESFFQRAEAEVDGFKLGSARRALSQALERVRQRASRSARIEQEWKASQVALDYLAEVS